MTRCKNGIVSVLLFMAIAVTACSGGPPPKQTVTPVRIAKDQPQRDANGNILTTLVTLPKGTKFTVQTLEFVSSQTARKGDSVLLEVDQSVLVNGAIAIDAGSIVKGNINSVSHAGSLGFPGSISIRLESAETVDGQRVRIRTRKKTEQKGDECVGSDYCVFFGWRKGNDVAFQPGTRITVYTDENVNVRAWRR